VDQWERRSLMSKKGRSTPQTCPKGLRPGSSSNLLLVKKGTLNWVINSSRLSTPIAYLLESWFCDVELVFQKVDLDYIFQISCLAIDLYPLLEKGFLLERAVTREGNPSQLGNVTIIHTQS
jgi:hypothetical protein